VKYRRVVGCGPSASGATFSCQVHLNFTTCRTHWYSLHTLNLAPERVTSIWRATLYIVAQPAVAPRTMPRSSISFALCAEQVALFDIKGLPFHRNGRF